MMSGITPNTVAAERWLAVIVAEFDDDQLGELAQFDSLSAKCDGSATGTAVEESRPATPRAGEAPSRRPEAEPDVHERLARYPIGKAAYEMVGYNSQSALRTILNFVRLITWKIPPYDPVEKDSASLEHLWDRIVMKVKVANPQAALTEKNCADLVLPLAAEGQVDWLHRLSR